MKNKKGFTIVELVIVIAVIAILAAVLIPTFSGVISKANQSSALQTARSTLTNALNMSSIAKLAGQKSSNGYQTMIVTDGHAFGYTGNELKQIDYPSSTSNVFKSITKDTNDTILNSTSNTYNSVIVAAANVSMIYDGTAENATALDGTLALVNGNTYTLDQVTPKDGATLTISDGVASIISKWASENKLGCTELTDLTVTVVGDHYYINYDLGYFKTEDSELDAAKTYYTLAAGVYTKVDSPDVANIGTYYEKKAASYDAELFVNGDFSKKVVVFTTFG